MMVTRKSAFLKVAFVAAWSLIAPAGLAAAPKTLTIANKLIKRTLKLDGQVYKTASISRGDGSDKVVFDDSREFHIRTMPGKNGKVKCWDIADYKLVDDGVCQRTGDKDRQLVITYQARKLTSANQPVKVAVKYFLKADEPYIRKNIELTFRAEGAALDRLEVERFVTKSPSSRGGKGEPVFIGG
jgi:hypothetical protein